MTNPHLKAPEGSRAIDWERERLIAAAPALLLFAQDAVKELDEVALEHEGTEEGDYAAKLAAIGRAAIAQAKGEGQ